MGLVRMGIPKEITLHLRNSFGIEYFVETGTYYGNTAKWASQYFVTHTIEKSEKLHKEAMQRNSDDKIHFYLGDSREILEKIIINTNGSIIFWLDAHWSGGETYGIEDECPLLEELHIIESKFPGDAFILIDDARLFTAPPPLPHKPEQWPNIQDIVELFSREDYYVTIFEDVIIIVPIEAKDILISYLQEEFIKQSESNSRNNIFRKLQYNIKKILEK